MSDIDIYYPIVHHALQGTPINVKSIHLIIRAVMEVIEGTPIKGSEQKDLALKILRQLFIDFTEDDTEKMLLALLDTDAIGNLIDLVVDASKNKIKVNKVIDTTATCFKFWIPRLFLKRK